MNFNELCLGYHPQEFTDLSVPSLGPESTFGDLKEKNRGLFIDLPAWKTQKAKLLENCLKKIAYISKIQDYPLQTLIKSPDGKLGFDPYTALDIFNRIVDTLCQDLVWEYCTQDNQANSMDLKGAAAAHYILQKKTF